MLVHQFVDRAPQGADAHLQLVGQGTLIGQRLGGLPLAGLNPPQQLALDLQVQNARARVQGLGAGWRGGRHGRSLILGARHSNKSSR